MSNGIVNWGAVILGVFLALFGGLFVTVGGWILGMAAGEAGLLTPFAAGLAALIPALLYVPLYLALRTRFPDFCRGFLVGGCLVIILGGICNAAMVTGMTGANFH